MADWCPNCQRIVGLTCACDLTFAEKLKTLRFATEWMPARTDTHKADGSYIDREALDDAFGPDRREQMLEETRGLGPVREADDGSLWVYDDPKTREMRPLERSDVIGGYLRGEHVEDAE